MARPDYEYLWRPSIETYAVVGWLVAAITAATYGVAAKVGTSLSLWIALLAFTLALYRCFQLINLWVIKTRLASFRVDKVSLDQVENIVKALNQPGKTGAIYLGHGFDVENKHSQSWYELRSLSINEITPPKWAMRLVTKFTDIELTEERDIARSAWIDAVESKKRPILLPMTSQSGHTFCLGATRAGKTTMLILNSYQRAFQGHVVLTVDPKGDDELERGLREVARRLNRPFVLIDPARPTVSSRLSLLANFNRYTEVPSRIVSVLPESDFKAFGWCFTSRYVAGMLMVSEKPSIAKIKFYIQGGSRAAADLLQRCIAVWIREHAGDPDQYIQAANEGSKKQLTVDKLIDAYHRLSLQHRTHDVIEGLIATYHHNDEHYQKITMNLLPVLEKLTAGELTGLFSPDASDLDDRRRIWDTESIIEQRAICYFRLDSLSDSEVGSAIGSIFLSNVVAVAGARYNQGAKEVRVSVLVDELSDIVNIPFVQLQNKGGGALFDLTFFTQSIADLTAKFGSTAYRDMILGNANNLISFRVSGKDSVDFVMDRIGMTDIKTVEFAQALSQRSEDNLAHFGGSVSRKVKKTEMDAFPRDLLSKLPTFHYIAVLQGGRVIKGVVPIVELPKTVQLTQRDGK